MYECHAVNCLLPTSTEFLSLFQSSLSLLHQELGKILGIAAPVIF